MRIGCYAISIYRPQNQKFLYWFTGECIKSSPAGKRRTAAENQPSQLSDTTNSFRNELSFFDGFSDAKDKEIQTKTPIFVVALGVVAVCSFFGVAIVTMFSVVQVSGNENNITGY